ncbi:MAG: SRPBCC family protein [Myxococcota bacterium]
MAEASITHEFSVSADTLWELIGDFGDMEKWAGPGAGSCTSDGEGLGALRTLTLPGGREVVDRLEAEGHRTYSYSIVRSTLPFVSYRATMAVEELGQGRCSLSWSGEFEPKGIGEAEAVATAESMYRYGIRLMEQTLAQR